MRNLSQIDAEYEPQSWSAPVSSLSAEQIVAKVIAGLPRPTDLMERLRFAIVVDELALLDGQAVCAILSQDNRRSGEAYVPLQTYALVVLAVDTFRKYKLTLTDSEALLRVVRNQIRIELVRLPNTGGECWLVPNKPSDQTAAHVGALLLSRRGETTRPWLWPDLPRAGKFRLVGDDAVTDVRARHPNCIGAGSFAHLARRVLRAA